MTSSDESRRARVVHPANAPLIGAVTVPGDKSIGHRALMLGALTRHGLCVKNLPTGADVRSTRRCLEALGIAIADLPGQDALGPGLAVSVEGKGIHAPFARPMAPLDCGNSGTTMRLLSGLLAGQPFPVELVGDESLSRRPMARIAEPLRQMGATVTLAANDQPPLKLHGKRPLTAIDYTLPMGSAQVKSCVLLAGLFADGVTRVTDAFATRDHTERMIGGLTGGKNPVVDGERIAIQPMSMDGGFAFTVPGDVSSAAFFAAAAVLVEGSAVVLPNVGLNPTRTGFFDALRDMGAVIAVERLREEAGERVGDLHIEQARLQAIDISAASIPGMVDEVPLLAVVATQATGTTRIDGLAELRHKESDRLAGTADNLRTMGAAVQIDGDALLISGPTKLRGAHLRTLGDHRLAMAGAIAALIADGPTTLDDATCVGISFPEFFAMLDALRSG